MTRSALEGIPGLGSTRRAALLRHFGSVKRVRAATVDELAEVDGIGEHTAQIVHAALAGEPSAAPPRALDKPAANRTVQM